jgi:hypothetical protein
MSSWSCILATSWSTNLAWVCSSSIIPPPKAPAQGQPNRRPITCQRRAPEYLLLPCYPVRIIVQVVCDKGFPRPEGVNVGQWGFQQAPPAGSEPHNILELTSRSDPGTARKVRRAAHAGQDEGAIAGLAWPVRRLWLTWVVGGFGPSAAPA